eukprot:Amastigsp_a512644_39.p2 type:complete len:126 gc:universal Amastigsp_a512644_39:626-249(-)
MFSFCRGLATVAAACIWRCCSRSVSTLPVFMASRTEERSACARRRASRQGCGPQVAILPRPFLRGAPVAVSRDWPSVKVALLVIVPKAMRASHVLAAAPAEAFAAGATFNRASRRPSSSRCCISS